MNRNSFGLLWLAGCAPETSTPAEVPRRECSVELGFEGSATSVEVAGRFNNWEPQPLEEVNGVWSRNLGQLQPSVYGYKFVVDGQWETPPPDVYTVWEDGFENRALYVGDCDLPWLQATSGAATPEGSLHAEFQFVAGSDGIPIDPATVSATVGSISVEAEINSSTGIITVSADGLPPGKHSVRVSAQDSEGQSPENGDAYLPLWVEPSAFRWQDGAMYYLFLDRFADGGENGFTATDGAEWGTDYLGGDLVGATQKLEEGYFEELGIRTIWLSPVNENPEGAFIGTGGHYYTGYHGYWPTEPNTVETRLGTSDIAADRALREFIDRAHDRGIRVLLDVVLNHVHEEHRYLDEHPDWFTAEPCVCTTDAGACNWDTNPVGCWFTDYLPDLDYQNPEIVNQFTNDLRWWIETYDVDGFRVDAAKHMDHVVLRTLSMQLRDRYETAGGAPFYLVGETFTGQGGQSLIFNYVAPYELDGQFEFPLLYPIRNVFGHDADFSVLANEIAISDQVYGDSVAWMSPFLGNHDVTRFATEVGGCDDPQLFGGCTDWIAEGDDELADRQALAFAFVLTQPGVPLIYYGDEVGLAGGPDPDNRRFMPWEWNSTQENLRDRIAEVSLLRTQLEALRVGDRQDLLVQPDLYAYARQAPTGEVAVVILYKGDSTIEVAVPIPLALGLDGITLTDELADETVSVSQGVLSISMAPWQPRLLSNE